MICPKCNIETEGKYCHECGEELPSVKLCPSCKKEVLLNAKFCPECRFDFNSNPESKKASTKQDSIGEFTALRSNVNIDQSQKNYYSEDPTVRKQATMTGVHCPVCHQIVQGADYFKCPECKKNYIHLEHRVSDPRDEDDFVCTKCHKKILKELTDKQQAINKEKQQAGIIEEGMLLAGRYKIEKFLGQGGMGQVYLATDNELEQSFALKFLPREMNSDKRALLDLKREVQAATRLNHGNIVRIWDLAVEDDMRFIKMEYINGPTLEDLLFEKEEKNEKFSWEEIKPWILQICEALKHSHSQNIIHRDLKPANIMITDNGQGVAKITDFGIARIMTDTMSRLSNRPTTGTIIYMAPEQIQAQELDERCDQYSLGIMLYELLNGRPPFYSGPIGEQHIYAKPKKLENIPDWLNNVMLKMLEKDPEKRYEKMVELLKDLEVDSFVSSEADKATESVHNIPLKTKPSKDADSTVWLKGNEMVFVEGGTFQMGSNDGGDNEKPVHEVTLDDFYISKYLVTFAEYDKFCEATDREKPADIKFWGRGNRPVINVSWDDAVAYCKWAGGRLPTEAEWEYACRGGSRSAHYKYAGSNNVDEVAWYSANSGRKTHPVGEKKPNELGLYDMSGNVFEWCSDWYDEDYYSTSPSLNPQGPSVGSYRVLRGGSWSDSDLNVRTANRSNHYPYSSYSDYGFRIARTY